MPQLCEPAAGNTATLAFNLTLSNTSSVATTASYATSIAGGAIAGIHYTAATGTATFAAGQTSTVVDVTVLHDNTYNPNLALDLNLSSPSNATLITTTAIGTSQRFRSRAFHYGSYYFC